MLDASRALECRHSLADGRSVVIRPLWPEDDAAARRFLRRLHPQGLGTRFLTLVRGMNARLLRAFVPVDPPRPTVLVCEALVGGERQLIGEARYAAIPGSHRCSFGIVVVDAWQRTGVARLLMRALLARAGAQGFDAMEGVVLRENRGMLPFLRALGFDVELRLDDASLLRVVKRLDRVYRDAPSLPPR